MYGNKIKYTIFGQSHSEKMGIILEGIPEGVEIDYEKLYAFMKRRAPGQSLLSTQRKEDDIPIITSGLNEKGITSGAPLSIVIENNDQKSKDYEKLRNIPRPGHSDYAAHIKYNGLNDIRGGGQFSGRLTAPLCAAGAIAKQILEEKGIFIGAHISSVHNICDDSFCPVSVDTDTLKMISEKDFPVISDKKGELMKKEILSARENLDSVGGTIECVVTGLKAGVGSFGEESIESRLSSVIFSIPAVKGIEFGAGFNSSSLFGSENNDEFYYDENGTVKTKTNNHGGILGGISSGMPIIFKTAIKPTPSIQKEQCSVNLETKENTTLVIEGRHDPCIVQRAVPVVEAAAALVILDIIL